MAVAHRRNAGTPISVRQNDTTCRSSGNQRLASAASSSGGAFSRNIDPTTGISAASSNASRSTDDVGISGSSWNDQTPDQQAANNTESSASLNSWGTSRSQRL